MTIIDHRLRAGETQHELGIAQLARTFTEFRRAGIEFSPHRLGHGTVVAAHMPEMPEILKPGFLHCFSFALKQWRDRYRMEGNNSRDDDEDAASEPSSYACER